MQFKLAFATFAALVAVVAAVPSPEVTTQLFTQEEMIAWLKRPTPSSPSSATLSQVSMRPKVLPRAPRTTRWSRTATAALQNVCGGSCTVYNGSAKCLNAPDTQCLAATNNVGFCDKGGCGGSCNQLSTCGTHLDNGYCYTPGTKSINVGNY
ncbi:uncharacterized protein B0H18DRAFT_389947 [Fomitopsis serialis]|uniref:uncharacterized protein n=1 Tax=Fomitopsis serialis TaxID=139415 RepID=UPI002007D307|nr:uncharacterized protein B0H18DRAFT_389947 [Neoantrodia serialis]KAH9925183.1 hypothetical protein B0H18DRAFT_389947 [Neoantrodia serialis]